MQIDSNVQLIASTISGALSATNVTTLIFLEGTIGGPVRVQGSATAGFTFGFVGLEVDRIAGPVSVTGFVGKSAGITEDTMGPLTFSDNVSSLFGNAIGGDTINGPATCSDNTPAPSSSFPSVVNGPTRGDQAATCTGD